MTKDELFAAWVDYPGDTVIAWYNEDPSSQQPLFLTDIAAGETATVVPVRILSVSDQIQAFLLADTETYRPSEMSEIAGEPFQVLLLRRE